MIAVMLDGCSFNRQPPTRFYILTTLPRGEGAPLAGTARVISIGVGPVELPQYTNRPQIVTGGHSTELRPAPFAHWAEPLRENFTRVLAENLSTLLATDRVMLYPWKSPMTMDYQIIVEVTQFLGEPGEAASLTALWSVVGKNSKEVLISKKSVFSEEPRSKLRGIDATKSSERSKLRGIAPVASESSSSHDYEALASTLSKLVASLSREIAATVAQLSQQPPRP
jgi:hypothetical protein